MLPGIELKPHALVWVNEQTEKQGRVLNVTYAQALELAEKKRKVSKHLRTDVLPMDQWCDGQGVVGNV